MTSERQQILDIITLPQSAEAFDGKLFALSDAFLHLRDNQGVKLSPKADEDWSAIHDLMLYRERLTEKVKADALPVTDPLTMIESAARYQVLSKDQAAGLTAEFMRKVHAIAGPDVSQAQAKKLFRFFADCNPLAQVDFLNGP